MATIRPLDLPAALSVSTTDALIVDKGSAVEKATPAQVIDAAIPLASQAEAEAGDNNEKRVTPLRVKQAIDALGVSETRLAATGTGQGASIVGARARGSEAVDSDLQTEARRHVWVEQYGAVAGSDCTAAIIDAMAEHPGAELRFGVGVFNVGNLGIIPTGTTFRGSGRVATILRKNSNGAHGELSGSVSFRHLTLDGNKANGRTGGGFTIGANTSQIVFDDFQLIDYDDYVLDFLVAQAGSQFSMTNGVVNRNNLSLPAIRFPDDGGQATPRYIGNVQTGGGVLCDTGGADNLTIVGCRTTNIVFGSNAAKVKVIGTRVASVGANIEVQGTDVTFQGCDVAGDIVLLSGAQNCVIGPNTFAGAHNITDNSGNNTNKIYMPGSKSFTPALTASGGGAAIGNGTITGSWGQQGHRIFANIELIFGSTTSFGTGDVRLSLPKVNGANLRLGVAQAIIGSTSYSGVSRVGANQDYVTARVHGSTANVNASNPAAWATGSQLLIQIEYDA